MKYTNFHYSFPTKYVFGEHAVSQIAGLLEQFDARRIVIFHGSTAQKQMILNYVTDTIESLGSVSMSIDNCPQNPDLLFLSQNRDTVKEFCPDFFIAIGGGSVIDAAKGMADYLQRYDIGIGTILTLPASGSEANRSFIIKDNLKQKKIAKADLRLVPKFAICDPTYTMSLSNRQVNCALADIMSHLLEQFFNLEEPNFVDKLILEGIDYVSKLSKDLQKDFYNLSLREDMMLLASFSLSYFLSCGRTMDWVAHTIEHTIAGIYDSNHGEGLSIIMPQWIEFSSSNPYYHDKLALLCQYLGRKQNECKFAEAYITDYFHSLNLSRTLNDMVGQNICVETIAHLTTQNGPIGKVNPISCEKAKEFLQLCC